MGYEMCTMMQDRNDSSGNSNNLIEKKEKKKSLVQIQQFQHLI